MANLSHLGGLNEVEQLDLDNYADNKENTFRLPAEGRYTLRAPDTFPDAAFGRTKAGALSVSVDPTISGPSNEGFTIKFVKISAKSFMRDGKRVSQVGDYLRACGVTGVIRSEQDIADLVEQTAGKIYEGKLVWRAYNTKTQWSLQGMNRFPKLADGTHQSWIDDPTPGAVDPETGKAFKVRANLVVDRFIPLGE
jgi:hypothetical protein